ncbi:cobalt ABC transporter permease [Oryzomonas rubra]|uniref:Cobalt ABC transporter permease n=1 Tax=Oryzomonas rubra TaxID=2509454 RepID=A0A5A9XKZ0_9BACT|nr:cobalt ABC transporter permease [Oryzomonas rubra]KAA0893440.1 cobalt ABC transporter permease [Oryzomonas rubra]
MKRRIIMISVLLWSVATVSPAVEQWQGIDETVVQKIAREHGREARKPLIDTGEGDIQLFVFLLAGAVGGFAAGYCWRALLDGRKKDDRTKE